MALTERLALLISAEDQGATSTLSKISDSAAGANTRLNDLSKVATAVGGVLGARKLFQITVAGLDELRAAQQVATQTEVVLKAQGAAAAVTAQQVGNLSDELLELSGRDDEAVRSAANLLLQFRNIGSSSDVFERALRGANDLSVALGTDVTSAAQTLGRALEQPDKAARSLRSANIILSEAQQEVIKSALAQNDVLAAQEVILRQVEAQVGGSAEAYGKTLSGQLDIAREKLTNAQAELVSGFAPAVEFGAKVTQGFADVLTGLPDDIQGVIGGLVFLGGQAAALAPAIATTTSGIESLRAMRAASAAATATETTATVAATTAMTAFAAANTASIAAVQANATATGVLAGEMAVLTTNSAASVAGLYATRAAAGGAALGFGAIALAIGTAVAAGYGLTKLFDDVLNITGGLGDFKDEMGDIGGALDSSLGGLAQKLRDTSTTARDDIAEITGTLVEAGEGGRIYAQALAAAGVTTGEFASVVAQGGDELEAWMTAMRNSKGVSDTQQIALEELVARINLQAQSTLEAAVAQGALTQAQLDNAIATSGGKDAAGAYVSALQSLADEGLIAQSTVDRFYDEAGDTSRIDAGAAAVDRFRQKLDDAKAAAEQAASAQRGLISADRRVEDTATAVEDAQLRLEEAKRDATTGIAERQADLDRSVADAQERLADAQEKLVEASRLDSQRTVTRPNPELDEDAIESAREAVQAAQRDVERAIRARREAAGDQVEANRDVEKAQRDLNRAVQDHAQALADQKVAEEEAEGRKVSAAGATQVLIDKLQAEADMYDGPVRDALLRYIDLLERAQTVAQAAFEADLSDLRGGLPQAGGSNQGIQRRATGGSFGPGYLLAGEDGPELLRIGQGIRGYANTASETARMTRRGDPTSITVVHPDAFYAADEMVRALRRKAILEAA